jgi:hypothetical protein
MTDDKLGPLHVKHKSGSESFCVSGQPAGFDLLEFWQWSASDLVDNTTRGVLAEFIVAKALGIDVRAVRVGWAPWDLETDRHVRIEVKSAAFLQSWGQKGLSTVQFVVPKRRAFDSENNAMEATPRRHADVYVFALLACQDKPTLDPLNLDQWQFFVLPTRALDNRTRSQHSITLRSLETLAGPAIGFARLAEAVENAAALPVAESSS